MSARYPFDPFALPERPDVPFPAPQRRRSSVPLSIKQRLVRGVVKISIIIAIVLLLAVLIFLPALISELARVEALTIEGRFYPISEFVDALASLALGSFVIAVSLVAFVLAASFTGRDMNRVVGYWTLAKNDYEEREHDRMRRFNKVTHV